MKKKSLLNKTLLLILFFILATDQVSGQLSEYEYELASIMASFKQYAFSDVKRNELISKTDELYDRISIQIKWKSYNDPDYYSFLSMQKKISAFRDYIRCFSKYASSGVEKEDFDMINSLLGIYPHTLDLKCDNVLFYELTIREFKAIFAFNQIKPNSLNEFPTLTIDYNIKYEGRIIHGESINVGGNLVRCINFKSDNQKFYPTIVSVTCYLAK